MALNYKKALEKFRQLAKDTDWYPQFNVLAVAFQENLDGERLFGSTEQSRRDRFHLLYRLDELARDHKLSMTFSDLCMNPSYSLYEPTEITSTSSLQEKENMPPPTQSPFYGNGNRWAVIVGVDNYQDMQSYGQLHVCFQDAMTLYKQLVAGGFKDQHIRLLASQEPYPPLRENIVESLQIVADATEPDDLLLFYFSGHGQAERGEGYLIPYNGRGVVLRDTAVPISRVKEIMGEARARAKVILLDACHSGANIEAKGKRPMSAEFIKNVFKEAAGLAIISSCQEGQYSYEWREKKSSVFTYYLIEALQGKADKDDKGFVTVHDVNRHVTHGVKQWAVQQNVSQSPTLNYLVTGDIVLLEYHQQTSEKDSLVSEKPSPSHVTGALNRYIGNLDALREGRVHQELTEKLEKEAGIKPGSRAQASTEDILERYHNVPLHALFLYTSEDKEIEAYISGHWGELDTLAGDVCDIHPVVDQFKKPQDENAYTFMQDITVLKNFDEYEQLPVLFFWDKHGATEYVSFGRKPDAATITHILRVLFKEIRRAPAIASVIRAKKKLSSTGNQPLLIQPTEQGRSNTVEMPDTFNQSPDFDFLYQILANSTTDLDLQEICRTVEISYNRLRGYSHAERAFSLTSQLDHQDRLLDLEKELRRRLPRRFTSPN